MTDIIPMVKCYPSWARSPQRVVSPHHSSMRTQVARQARCWPLVLSGSVYRRQLHGLIEVENENNDWEPV